MATPAVEFVAHGKELHLIYRPDDGVSWVHGRFAEGEPLEIKGTFHLTEKNLAQGRAKRRRDDFGDEDSEVRFVVATAQGKYFVFFPEIIQVTIPVLAGCSKMP